MTVERERKNRAVKEANHALTLLKNANPLELMRKAAINRKIKNKLEEHLKKLVAANLREIRDDKDLTAYEFNRKRLRSPTSQTMMRSYALKMV